MYLVAAPSVFVLVCTNFSLRGVYYQVRVNNVFLIFSKSAILSSRKIELCGGGLLCFSSFVHAHKDTKILAYTQAFRAYLFMKNRHNIDINRHMKTCLLWLFFLFVIFIHFLNISARVEMSILHES